MKQSKIIEFVIGPNKTLTIRYRLYVLDVENLHREITEEAHYASYAMHLGSTEMYLTLKTQLTKSAIISGGKVRLSN